MPEHRPGVSPWWRKQTCLAGSPSSLLWIKTSTAPLTPALCDGLPQNATWRRGTVKEVTAMLHRTGKAQGKGCRGDWPESTQKRRGEEEAAPCSSPLVVVAGLLGTEQDPGTGSNVCAGSKPKQSWSSLSRRREARELPASEASRCRTCRRGAGELGSETGTRGMLQASSWARRGVPGRSERAERSPGEN